MLALYSAERVETGVGGDGGEVGFHANIYGAHMLRNIRAPKQRYATAADASWELVNGRTASACRWLDGGAACSRPGPSAGPRGCEHMCKVSGLHTVALCISAQAIQWAPLGLRMPSAGLHVGSNGLFLGWV